MGQVEVLFDAMQETSPEDTDKINRIAKGAYDLMREFSIMGHGNLMNIQTVAIDLTVVHAKTPLRLDDMLAVLDAERKGDLLHDVIGIANNLDRSTGELANCFMPRFMKPQEERNAQKHELDEAERRNATVLYELFGAIDEFVGSNDWSLPSFRVYSGRHRVVYIHEADLPDHNLYYVAMYDADQNGVPLACEEEHIIYTGTPKEFGYAFEEARIVMKCLAVLEKQESN